MENLEESRPQDSGQTAIEASATDEEKVSQAVLAFAMDLYQELRETKQNLFFSPYGISSVLAMTYAGARGSTESEMADILYFSLPQEDLHLAWSTLNHTLSTRDQIDSLEGATAGFVLRTANSIWAVEGHAFLPEFLRVLQQTHGAGLQRVETFAQPEEARQRINRWMNEQTEEKIPEILPPGILDSLTRLILVNAVYFKAAWMVPFEETSTEEGLFELLDSSRVMVPFMSRQGGFQYVQRVDYEIVEIPYVGGQLVLDILLPSQGNYQDLEVSLDSIWLRQALEELETTEVRLKMPRFKIESQFQLRQALNQLGILSAFGPEADFSGMDGIQDLYLTEMVHQTFVRVDEAGTEAAAATAVLVQGKRMPVSVVQLSLDRPFIFFIRDLPTQTMLFVGRLLDPTEE